MRDGPVVVVGSAVEDLTFRVETLPFPGETATARGVAAALGGKGANQAAAAARLGAPTVFLGRVGEDEAGAAMRADLEAFGIELHLLPTPGVPTGLAAVLVDDEGENQIVVHPGANALLVPADLAAVEARLRTASVFVTQLEIPLETVRAALEIARRVDARTVLNAAPVREGAAELLAGFEVVVVNQAEATHLTGIGVDRLDDAHAAVRALRDLGVEAPVVTMGPLGAVYVDHGRTVHAPAPRVDAVDTTGAGDAFVGALAAHLREGADAKDAVTAACRYAALATTRAGTRAAFVERAALHAAFPEDD